MLSGIGGAALFTPIFILVFPLLGPEYVLSSTVAAIGTAPVAIMGTLAAGAVHDSVLLASHALLVAVLSVVMWRNRPPATVAAVAMKDAGWRTIVDSKGHSYAYDVPRLGAGSNVLTAMGAFLTGMV